MLWITGTAPFTEAGIRPKRVVQFCNALFTSAVRENEPVSEVAASVLGAPKSESILPNERAMPDSAVLDASVAVFTASWVSSVVVELPPPPLPEAAPILTNTPISEGREPEARRAHTKPEPTLARVTGSCLVNKWPLTVGAVSAAVVATSRMTGISQLTKISPSVDAAIFVHV